MSGPFGIQTPQVRRIDTPPERVVVVSESSLFHAYRNSVQGLRTEPCVCGESITCEDEDRTVYVAVEAHNQSTAHRQWREDNRL